MITKVGVAKQRRPNEQEFTGAHQSTGSIAQVAASGKLLLTTQAPATAGLDLTVRAVGRRVDAAAGRW